MTEPVQLPPQPLPGEFERPKFLGVSVRFFSTNAGWNRETSTLTIGLVEDRRNNEEFKNPGLHSLCFFEYEGWSYYGILTNVDERAERNGNRVFEVTISDPRQFLDGVDLILADYSGDVRSVPNLMNIYGYLESIEFGYSNRTSAGIPYSKILEAFRNLGVLAINRNNSYEVVYNDLPLLDGSYRFPETDITLLELINRVCEITNHDYLIYIDKPGRIRIKTVNRSKEYKPGSISRYLGTKKGYSSANYSLQAEFNLMNKFIIGPPVEEVKYQFYNEGQDPLATERDDTIENFWGVDRYGNLIFPNPLEEWNNRYSVTVEGFSITDVRYLQNPIEGDLDGPTFDTKYRDFTRGYTFTIGELRAAMISRESWESYITFFDYKVPEGSNIPRSLHEGKSEKIGLRSEVNNTVALDILFNNRNIFDINPAEISALRNSKAVDDYSDREDYIQRVYDFVKNYAENYYGVKFLIKTPFVFAKYNEYGEIETSYEPCESGYIDESLYGQAIQSNLLPYYIDLVKNEENKITPYVRYDAKNLKINVNGVVEVNDEGISIGSLPFGSYYIGNTKEDPDDKKIIMNSLFVKVELDSKVYFERIFDAFGPRVVITLPGPISRIKESGYDPDFVLKQVLENKGLTEDEKKEQIKRFRGKTGSDAITFGGGPLHVMPDMAAVTLRDKLRTYGPWNTNNGNGRVQFEKNDELAPWNFGGFDNLNIAANILVSEIGEPRFFGEAGTVEFAGLPDTALGDEIVTDGPIVSNISVNVGDSGVVTRYTLGRWDMKNGRNAKYLAEQIRLVNDSKKEILKIKKELTKLVPPIGDKNRVLLAENKRMPRRRVSNSSSQMLVGDISKNSDTDFYQSNVASMPFYTCLDNLREENWQEKGGVSLDGIFRPFSTNPDASGITKYESYSGSDSTPNINTLNPFKQGHDIQTVFYGSGIPEDLSRESYTSGSGYEDCRPLALRGPIVVAGYGFDINGNPVPSSGNGEFIEDYMHRSDQWKVGPVDLRWDFNRKVWVSSIDGQYIAKLEGGFIGKRVGNTPGEGFCSIYDIISGSLVPVGISGILWNTTVSDITSDYVNVGKKGSEFIYMEGGRQLRPFITDHRTIVDGETMILQGKIEQHWVYPYSGEPVWVNIIGSDPC